MITFEELPEEHIRRARAFGWDLAKMVRDGMIELVYLRPVDLTVEEVLERIERAIEETGAKRVVINSISGFKLALAPGEREDFRETLYRLTVGLLAKNVTIFMTTEVAEALGEPQFSAHQVSFLTDNIVLLRYVVL